MKKQIIATSALVALAVAAVAGPLNTKGLPSESQGVIHLDFEASQKSNIVQAITKESEKKMAKNAAEKKSYEALKKDLGFDPAQDITDITIGLLPSVSGANEPDAVGIVRGKFSSEKILAALKTKKIATKTYNKATLVDMGAFLAAYAVDKEVVRDIPDDTLLAIVDKNTFILGKDGIIQKAIDTNAGSVKSYAAPATLSPFGKQLGTPIVLLYASGKLDPSEPSPDNPMAMPKMDNLYFALAESSKDAQARLAIDYPTVEDASGVQSKVQMLLGFLQMGLSQTNGPDGQPDPQKVENAKKVGKLLGALKLSTSGKSFMGALDYPSAEIIDTIREQAAKM